ncbi:MAG: hypothetical protein KKF30_01065 [Proteobacteria bacterium]|nr:hypothetical protein [Pseudomonadota bacterium]MBU4470784.1 hypothetical protein [Pseudomonadota bacterium]MCG2751488.1 hypothetical protein [Desulfobacteraceae bacterium]
MSQSDCENCKFRAKYDKKPKSFLGRLWRWHANWCPGWRKYITALPDEDRKHLALRYQMEKYQK